MAYRISLTDLMEKTAPPGEIHYGPTPAKGDFILNGTATVSAVHVGAFPPIEGGTVDLVEAHLF